MKKNILITGATGNLGGLVATELLKKVDASNIFALARDVSRAKSLSSLWITVRQGDYSDIKSLESAMVGIDTLYLVSSSNPENRFADHKNAIDAAKTAGVQHIVYTSFDRIRDTGSPIQFIADSHIQTEEYLLNSGIAYTILYHGLYLEVLPGFLGSVADSKVVYFPAGEWKAAFTSREDLAIAAANILSTSGHENQKYRLVNSASYSFHDVADIYTKILGFPVTYVSPDIQEYRATLLKNGVPEMYVDMGSAFAEAIKEGDFEATGNTLEKILGRKAKGLGEYLKEIK